MTICPCCHQDVEGRPDPASVVASIDFNATERAVMECLARSFGRWIPTEALTNKVYSCRADGGPISANNCLSVTIHRLRKSNILTAHGFEIKSRNGRGSCGYCLTWINEQEGKKVSRMSSDKRRKA
jgi:DNA-binding response OmpR family regulator